jgi:hypothetical protein
MKKTVQIIILSIVILAFTILACEPPKSYPSTPEISFKSVNISYAIDSLDNEVKRILLTFSVIDGDGDVGIFIDNNYIYPGFEDLDSSDLFITLYEKINQEFVEVLLEKPMNYRIPYLEPEGQDKSLKADIEVTIDYPLATLNYDTIKYSFYIYDREKHMSNIAESIEIPLDTIGTISKKQIITKSINLTY